jgi:hypothetical protein
MRMRSRVKNGGHEERKTACIGPSIDLVYLFINLILR